jgi:hypothetical protein
MNTSINRLHTRQPNVPMDRERHIRKQLRSFSAYAAAAVFAVVFVGFARTYYLRFLFHLPPLDWLLQVHGALMTGWFVLFFVQVWLATHHRIAIHRKLGWIGLAQMLGIVGLGTFLAIRSAARDLRATVGVGPLAFMEFLLIDLFLFAAFVSVAIVMRRKSGYHMRFMLLACLSMSGPGISRIPFRELHGLSFLAGGGPFGLFGLDLLLLYGCVIIDTIRNRRLHPAFVLGGLPLIFIDTPLLARVLQSSIGVAFGGWLVSFQG